MGKIKFQLESGRYIIAVSGGVDSVVLLHLLANSSNPKCTFVAAHFDHGIQKKSHQVANFVEALAKKKNLPFELGHGFLGERVSEAKQRVARYKFLHEIQKKHKANAIITAHHQDDKIETAVLQTLRGAGRYGLDPFSRMPGILRPLANTPKADILAYAKTNNLKWMEDPSNKDLRFKRNFIRLHLLPLVEQNQPNFRKRLVQTMDQFAKANIFFDQKLDLLLKKTSLVENDEIHFKKKELLKLKSILRQQLLHFTLTKYFPHISLNSAQIKRLSDFCESSQSGSKFPLAKNIQVKTTKDHIELIGHNKP